MSMNEKLAYLAETKEQIKAALINKGANITPSTTFRSYVDAINNLKIGGEGDESVGSVKLFDTINDMNADTTIQEGDMAVVYGAQFEKLTSDKAFSSLTVLPTVVLNEAVTDYTMIYGASNGENYVNIDAMLEATRMSLRVNTSEVSSVINYTSTDGITYTVEGSPELTIELGEVVQIEWYDWYDIFGEFIQVGGYNFGGFFQAEPTTFSNLLSFIPFSNINRTNPNYSVKEPVYDESTMIDVDKLYAAVKTGFDWTLTNRSYRCYGYAYWSVDNKLKVVVQNGCNNGVDIYPYDDGSTITVGAYAYDLADYMRKYWVLDIEISDVGEYTVSGYNGYLTNYVALPSTTNYYYTYPYVQAATVPVAFLYGYGEGVSKYPLQSQYALNSSLLIAYMEGTAYKSYVIEGYTAGAYKVETIYNVAPTQFNATALQLLPNARAYSSNGSIEGTEETYNYLDANLVMKYVLGVTDTETELKKYKVSSLSNKIGASTYSKVLGLNFALNSPVDKKLGTILFGDSATTTNVPITNLLSFPRSLQVGNDVYMLANNPNAFAHLQVVDGKLNVVSDRTVTSLTGCNTYSMDYDNGYVYAVSLDSSKYLKMIKIEVAGTGNASTFSGSTSSTYAIASVCGIRASSGYAYVVNTSGALYRWKFSGNSFSRLNSSETFSLSVQVGQNCKDYLFIPSTTKIHLFDKATGGDTAIAMTWANTTFKNAMCLEDDEFIYCIYGGNICKIDKATLTLVSTGTYSTNYFAGCGSSNGVMKVGDGYIVYPAYQGWTTSTGVYRTPHTMFLKTDTLELSELASNGYGCSVYDLESDKISTWSFDEGVTSTTNIYNYVFNLAEVCDFANGDIPIMAINNAIYMTNKDSAKLN